MKKYIQKGLSLIEMTITLLAMGLLLFLVFSALDAFQDISGRATLVEQQKTWHKTLELIHLKYGYQLAQDKPVIVAQAVNITLDFNRVPDCGTNESFEFGRGLLALIDSNSSGLLLDPWGGKWCAQSSALVTLQHKGLDVAVRPLAMFSPGPNRVFNTDVRLQGLVCPNNVGDDTPPVCENGSKDALENLNITAQNLKTIEEAFDVYAQSRESATPQVGFINYFINNHIVVAANNCSDISTDAGFSFDNDGVIAPTSINNNFNEYGLSFAEAFDNAADFPNLQNVLGISVADTYDGWGNPIFFDNSSCSVRHQYNPDDLLNTPPFSMRVIAILPGGQEFSKYIFSTF